MQVRAQKQEQAWLVQRRLRASGSLQGACMVGDVTLWVGRSEMMMIMLTCYAFSGKW